MKGPLPTSVVLPRSDDTPAFAPDEVRELERITGRTFLDVMDTEDIGGYADALQAMVWLTLRREGYSPTWHDCAQIVAVPGTP